MRGLIGRAVERRGMPGDGGVGWSDPSAIPPNSAFSRQLAGVVVNEATALQIITVLSCVRIITGVVGGFPIEAITGPHDKPNVIPPDDAPALCVDPFTEVDLSEGIEMGVASLMLHGNAYYYVVDRDRRGVPTLLEPLPWPSVLVRRVEGRIVYKVNKVAVPTADIIHLRWISLPGAAVGLSPIEYAAQGLGITLAAEEYGARFFAQGATVSGVLESDQELSPQSALKLAKDFQSRHGGLAQSHLPLVLDSGLKWRGIQVAPEQAQFLATRGYQRSEVEALFGVPPHLLGDTDGTTSWGAGIQDQKQDFLAFTIDRYTRKFRSAWNRAMRPYGIRMRFNPDQFLAANQVDKMNAITSGRASATVTVNDGRRMLDLPVLDDPRADDPFQPLNSAPVPIKGTNEGGDGPK